MLLTVSINTPELLKILDASPHAVKLMIDRGISIDDANSYVADAKVMFIQAKGERQAFYSEIGAATVTIEGNILRTVFPNSYYDKEAEALMEVLM